MILAAVHTTGVNWESILTVILSLTTVVGGFTGWLFRRLDRNRSRSESFVRDQIKVVSDALSHRLDAVDRHLEQQDRQVDNVSTRVARLEGPVRRAAEG